MANTKQFMTDFLKKTGATEETITQFGEMYDNDIQEAIQQEAQGRFYQSREEQTNMQQTIAAAALKHNIRNK